MSANAKQPEDARGMTSGELASLQTEVLELFAAREGHFRFESGHHGDLWLDIPPAYIEPKRLRRFAAELASMLSSHEVEAVCGPMVEGALLAQMVAEEISAEFYFAEQFQKSGSNGLYPIGYRVPKAMRAAIRGKRTAVVDDVINAGSAVRGACEDLRECGASVVAIGALMALGSSVSELASSLRVPLKTLVQLSKNALWAPSSCPLCAAGVALGGIG
jgi:orotate phosphoribosyltransferase